MQKQDFMLDTVVIKLRHPAFRVTDPNFFTPALAIPERGTGFSYQYGRHRYVKYVQNPTGEDKRGRKIYKPNLTAYQRSEANGSCTTYTSSSRCRSSFSTKASKKLTTAISTEWSRSSISGSGAWGSKRPSTRSAGQSSWKFTSEKTYFCRNP